MEKKATLSQRLKMAALAILIGLGVVGGHRYYLNNFAIYKAGTCLVDAESGVPLFVKSVEKNHYKILIFGIFELPVRFKELNTANVYEVSCESGEPK